MPEEVEDELILNTPFMFRTKRKEEEKNKPNETDLYLLLPLVI